MDELHQITDAWNQVRTEKMWQRAPSGMEDLGETLGGAAAPTSAERQGSDPSEDLAWMASLPDDAQVQVRAALSRPLRQLWVLSRLLRLGLCAHVDLHF